MLELLTISVSVPMLKWSLSLKPDSKEMSCKNFENIALITLKSWRTDSGKQLNRHDKVRPFLKPLCHPGWAEYIDVHQLTQIPSVKLQKSTP